MPGPRKVRVFRNPKKSPNWYIEWRDAAGRRHCESCGPGKGDAQDRARQVRADLQRERLSVCGRPPVERLESATGNTRVSGTEDPSARPSSVIRVHALLKCAEFELPVDLLVEVNPELLESLSHYIPPGATPSLET